MITNNLAHLVLVNKRNAPVKFIIKYIVFGEAKIYNKNDNYKQ